MCFKKTLIAKVILPIPSDKTFGYLIPKYLQHTIKERSPVLVSLRSRKQYLVGIILKIEEKIPESDISYSYVLDVLTQEPIIFENQLRLWRWMKTYYLCSMGHICAMALPITSYLKTKNKTIIIDNDKIPTLNLSPEHIKIINFVKCIPNKSYRQLLSRLESNQISIFF